MGTDALLHPFASLLPERRSARRLLRELNLTVEQAQYLDTLLASLRQLRRDAREGWNYQRNAVPLLLASESFDRDDALRLARVPIAMISDALPHAVDCVGVFHDSLDHLQRARLHETLLRRDVSKTASPTKRSP